MRTASASFSKERVFPDAISGNINLNIRWHQTQLLSWDYAYAYVTPGLHTYFSDISISIIKHKKMKTIPFSYANVYVYACVYAFAHAHVAA